MRYSLHGFLCWFPIHHHQDCVAGAKSDTSLQTGKSQQASSGLEVLAQVLAGQLFQPRNQYLRGCNNLRLRVLEQLSQEG